MIEREIRQKERRGILVPMVMNFMQHCPIEIETAEDIGRLTDLMMKTMIREEERRDGKRYYSPSSLGEHCLRKSYLGRHAVINPDAPSPYGLMSHYYFFTGNFIHLKWQFAMYKLEKYIANSSIFRVHDSEIPVASKHGDHRGTIDQIVFIYEEPYILDWKGLNVFSAKKIGLGKVPIQYRTQVGDYLVLWNSQRKLPFRIEKALLMVEDKGGGEKFLQEALITLERDGKRARRRLDKLRAHETTGMLPPPACHSLKDKGFQDCQFKTICWPEVEAAGKEKTQRVREAMAKKEPTTAQRVAKVLKARR